MKTVVIDGVEYTEKTPVLGNYHIVRCDRSGVFAGELESLEGQTAVMKNVRCLWHWEGAFSILELALEGTSEPSQCKFTVHVPKITVTDAIELVPCTEKAMKSIEGVAAWRI